MYTSLEDTEVLGLADTGWPTISTGLNTAGAAADDSVVVVVDDAPPCTGLGAAVLSFSTPFSTSAAAKPSALCIQLSTLRSTVR